MSHTMLGSEISERIRTEIRFRDSQEGIGIDPLESDHPEGIFTVTRHDNPADPHEPAYFDFAISAIDSHLLDPDLSSIRRLLSTVQQADPLGPVDLDLPGERGQFAFSQDHSMPAFTLTGTYSEAADGFGDFALRRTRVRPDLYKVNDAALLGNTAYRAAAELAWFIRRGTRPGSQAAETLHPSTVSTTLGHVMSIGVAELAIQGKMPPLLFPDRASLEIWTPSQVKNPQSVRITSEPRSLLPYQQHQTIDIVTSSTRPRRLRTRQWINAMLVSHSLEDHHIILDVDEIEVLARWFNRRKVRSTEAKYGGIAINPEEFIGAEIRQAA